MTLSALSVAVGWVIVVPRLWLCGDGTRKRSAPEGFLLAKWSTGGVPGAAAGDIDCCPMSSPTTPSSGHLTYQINGEAIPARSRKGLVESAPHSAVAWSPRRRVAQAGAGISCLSSDITRGPRRRVAGSFGTAGIRRRLDRASWIACGHGAGRMRRARRWLKYLGLLVGRSGNCWR